MPVTTIILFCLLAATTLTVSIPGRPASGVLQCGSFALLAAVVLRREPPRWNWLCVAVTAVAAFGVAQIVLGTTVSPWLTANSALQWASWAALAWIAAQALADRSHRRRFIECYAAFAGLVAVACLLQPALGLPSYDDRAGPFQNRNTYSSFVELALPAAAWLARGDRQRQWLWWGVCAILTASVLATGSRAGGAIVLAEFAIILLTASSRPKTAIATAALAAGLIGVAGWDTLSWRMRLGDPLSHRREFYQSGLRMAAQRPLTGFGLGTFPEVYPGFAVADFGRTVNRAHSDWLEFAADGGAAMPLLFAAALVAMVPAVRRHWWAAGMFAVALHALVDYPFSRSGVAVWFWVLGSAALRQPSFDRVRAKSRESVAPSGRSLATARR